jgi:hypothetical protein
VSERSLGRGHQRARELAALRADEALSPNDEAWLADHLEYCDACAEVAAEYDAQHDLFAGLRAFQPEPPRELWARTFAAIDAERTRSASPGPRRISGAPRAPRHLPFAPIVALAMIVTVVGVGLLSSHGLVPGGVAGPTPIALAEAADIQVIARDSAGNIRILTRAVDQVCPVGTTSCGVQPTFAVTAVTGVASATNLSGTLSPTGAQMVLVSHDADGGVYVVPVSPATNAAPAESSSPSTSASATTAISAAVVSPSAPAPPSPSASSEPASSVPDASPSQPGTSASSAAPPSATEPPAASEGPESPPVDQSSQRSSAPPDSSAPVSTASPLEVSPPLASQDSWWPPIPPTLGSAEPSSSPTTDMTPPPETAVQIASGVTVVGQPIYAPDGLRLAFAATPSDGSAGPDIYVWDGGDGQAIAITSDHGSWLAGWTANGILVSRVTGGIPFTYLLDPATGSATPVGAPATWLPAVSPDGSMAAWWSGSLKLAADGVSWVPDVGNLVLGAWPSTVNATPQILSMGPLASWQVRWADDFSSLAVWTDAQGSQAVQSSQGVGGSAVAVGSPVAPTSTVAEASPLTSLGQFAQGSPIASSDQVSQGGVVAQGGRLSLYRVMAPFRYVDLANPLLDAVPASPDFSLRTGRLAWTAPSPEPPQVVQVLAWSGDAIGRLEVQSDGSGAVIP